MKKIWLSLLVGTALLGGCASQSQSTTSKTNAKTSQSSKVANNKTEQAAKSSNQATNSNTSTKSQVVTTLWNTTKRAKLSKFMASWQSQMGQTYVGTYDGKIPNHLGYKFPTVFENGQLKGRVVWGQQSVELSWSKTGENGSALQVVAVATGGKSDAQFPTTYFFCIHNGRPAVLMTQTTNGDQMYIEDTQNSALQAGFAEIVTGSKPATLTDTTLNADVISSVKANQWPQAYYGTWYYYDKYEKKVTSFDQTETSDLKLSYLPMESLKWVNIRGAHQSAGAGNYEYVRYHYYDGKQVPVMIMGSGAEAWFDGNAYQSRAMAAQMQEWQYGDESKTSDAE